MITHKPAQKPTPKSRSSNRLRKQHRNVLAPNPPPNAVIACTDGSSLNNGTMHARAGCGVCFMGEHTHAIAARLPGPTQTNNRAEIWAFHLAMHHALVKLAPDHLHIRSDSALAVNVCNEHLQDWKMLGWRTIKGRKPKNLDLWKKIDRMMHRVRRKGWQLTFQHVCARVCVCVCACVHGQRE